MNKVIIINNKAINLIINSNIIQIYKKVIEIQDNNDTNKSPTCNGSMYGLTRSIIIFHVLVCTVH